MSKRRVTRNASAKKLESDQINELKMTSRNKLTVTHSTPISMIENIGKAKIPSSREARINTRVKNRKSSYKDELKDKSGLGTEATGVSDLENGADETMYSFVIKNENGDADEEEFVENDDDYEEEFIEEFLDPQIHENVYMDFDIDVEEKVFQNHVKDDNVNLIPSIQTEPSASKRNRDDSTFKRSRDDSTCKRSRDDSSRNRYDSTRNRDDSSRNRDDSSSHRNITTSNNNSHDPCNTRNCQDAEDMVKITVEMSASAFERVAPIIFSMVNEPPQIVRSEK